MQNLLTVIAGITNGMHDFIIKVSKAQGFNLSDKDLHFWIVGALGIGIFIFTDILFKRLARWSISAISFIYTLTVLVVIVFGLEIEQKITGRGNMEFADIVAGLWGFIAIFAIYAAIKALIFLFYKFIRKTGRRRMY